MDILISLLIFALIAWLVIWIVGLLPIPEPAKTIVLAIVGVILLIHLLGLIGLVPGIRYPALR